MGAFIRDHYLGRDDYKRTCCKRSNQKPAKGNFLRIEAFIQIHKVCETAFPAGEILSYDMPSRKSKFP